MPFECARCTNCCKTYWIAVIPTEAKRIAKQLNKNVQDFVRNDCWLSIQLYASMNESNPFWVSAQQLEKTLGKKDWDSKGYLAIPSLVLKRDLPTGACNFLDGKNCSIYSARPGQCELFPLIGFDAKKKISSKDYDFCVGLNGHAFSPKVKESKAHFERVKRHLDAVKENGFKSVWTAWPNSGFVFLDKERVAEISEERFLELVN